MRSTTTDAANLATESPTVTREEPGFWARPIAVPVDAMVLLGQDMEVVAYTPQQLQEFPTFTPSGNSLLPDDTVIKVGLAKPSH